MKINTGNRFYCFSPPVMVATFLIEIILAVFVLYRYRQTIKARLIIGLLLCLSIFQFAEYFVCTDSTVAILASRIGYVAITFLPPLGLHLMSTLTKTISKKTIRNVYVLTGAFCAYFLLAPSVFQSNICTGNYVIFQLNIHQVIAYSLFYFGLIIASVQEGFKYLKNTSYSDNSYAVRWLIAGYGVFVIPSALVVVFHPDTSKAIPSIMCGFAIILALILALKIAPATLKKK